MSEEELLKAGISAARLGNMAQAASLFAQTVKENPASERGWYLLGMSCSAPDQREYCLRRALALNPNHPEAIKQLAGLSKPSPTLASAQIPIPPTSTPRPPALKTNKSEKSETLTPPLKVDDLVLKEIEERRKKSSQTQSPARLILSVGGGCVSAIAAATVWALIAYITKYQFSLVAIGVGLVVGYTMKALNKDGGFTSGIIASALAVFGCLLGNFLAVSALISTQVAVPVPVVAMELFTHPSALADVISIMFGFKEILFYGLAMFASFRTSI